ncbi:predicted protein [Uncinocarpus reesii 1704]|uniref:Uncharacterized protein n=1 Tax=Uncinocarpus reesii (strain UAMH 1704) TaxID=336963 RepID=C4JKI3_UNCRE|nr:uncharacterized protein UREG_02140 [Uncinocarpus reesii 1704]EEP77291.1 predicted protein [Uncinocarpus reesii 1704]
MRAERGTRCRVQRSNAGRSHGPDEVQILPWASGLKPPRRRWGDLAEKPRRERETSAHRAANQSPNRSRRRPSGDLGQDARNAVQYDSMLGLNGPELDNNRQLGGEKLCFRDENSINSGETSGMLILRDTRIVMIPTVAATVVEDMLLPLKPMPVASSIHPL